MLDHINVADTVFLDGKIVTVDSKDSIAESVAIKDGRIIHVGITQDVKGLIGDETRVIQLQGKTVLPGFIDSHTHIEGIANYHLMLDIHVPPLKGVEEILEKVKKKTQETPKGEWIVGAGGWGQPLPSKDDIDAVAPEHPVVLRESAHDQVLNSKALEMANILKDTPDPPGGKIWRSPETGEPTGHVSELWHSLRALMPPHSYEVRKNSVKEVLHEQFIRQGLTSVYDFPSPDGVRIYQELFNSNELPLRLLFQTIISRSPDDDSIMKTGLRTGFGNDWLKIGGIKIFVDGEGKTAVRYFPPGQKEKWTGVPKITQEELNKKVFEAHEAGFQVWIHAIGDKAQDMTLHAFELALQKKPRKDHRHRIEHAGNNEAGPTTLEQLDRMKKLEIIPVPTAAWIYLGSVWETAAEKRFIYRTLLDRGFRPPGNSDSLGSMPESINPLFSIWCLVTRKTRTGQLNCPEESITVMEAIRQYTIDAAYSGFEEKVKGSIEKGKYADLIILSDDPLTVPVDEIKNINVEATIVDGKIAYQNQSF